MILRSRENIIETWMLSAIQDGGVDRYDDLHIDRIDALHSEQPRDSYFGIPAMLWTATVLDALKCHRLSFTALQKIQKRIMSQTGGSFQGEKPQRAALGCAHD